MKITWENEFPRDVVSEFMDVFKKNVERYWDEINAWTLENGYGQHEIDFNELIISALFKKPEDFVPKWHFGMKMRGYWKEILVEIQLVGSMSNLDLKFQSIVMPTTAEALKSVEIPEPQPDEGWSYDI